MTVFACSLPLTTLFGVSGLQFPIVVLRYEVCLRFSDHILGAWLVTRHTLGSKFRFCHFPLLLGSGLDLFLGSSTPEWERG